MEEPAQMKALLLEGPQKISVKNMPIPKPANGQVLIKVMAAPINPSDVVFIKDGGYAGFKPAPCIAGFEGSGVVIENGGGIMGWGLVGKKVAFTPTQTSGTYAQYALASSSQCFPVDKQMSYQHASMSFVNPLTAIAMLDIVKSKSVKAVIINAAASSLGRMLNRFLPPEGIQIINIVRKEEQVQVLRKEGADYILNSNDPQFQEKLSNLGSKLQAKICFDAIGGSITGKILKLMPKESTLYIYGALSGENIRDLDAGDMIYSHKSVEGLLVSHWIHQKGILKMLPSLYKLRKLLLRQLKSEIAVECSLQQFEKSLKDYTANMTRGKVVVKPFDQPKTLEEKDPIKQ